MPFKKVSTWILGIGFALAIGIWSYSFRVEANYAGFSPNDGQQHRAYVDAVYRGLEKGHLPLDLWGDHCCFGSPIFRMYQYLPHWIAATLMRAFSVNSAQSIHFLIVFFWMLQFPLAYFAARSVGLSRRYAYCLALFSPLISSVGLGSQSLRSYIFKGTGMFAQAAGAPFLYTSLGLSLGLSGWVREVEKFNLRRAVEQGLLISFIFLMHHYMGFLALFAFVFLSFSGCICRYCSWRTAWRHVAVVGALFVALTVHQFYSFVIDSPLVFQNTWDRPELWNGFGLYSFVLNILRAGFSDLQRMQFLSILTVIGFLSFYQKGTPRVFKGLGLLMGATSLFIIGPEMLGPVWRLCFGFLQPERFLVLFQISLLWIAAYGFCIVLDKLARFPRTRFQLQWVPVALCFVLLAYVHYDRLLIVEESAVAVQSQEAMNEPFDSELVHAMGDPSERARYWFDGQWMGAQWGAVPFQSILAELGYAHVTLAEHSMSYGTEMTRLFDPKNPVHFSIFNVNRVLLNAAPLHSRSFPGAFPPPEDQVDSSLKKLYGGRLLSVYQTPNDGAWGLITVPKVSYSETPFEFRNDVQAWLQKANKDEYPAILPRSIVNRWPTAVPAVSKSPQPGGRILSQTRPLDGASTADFETVDDQHYGVFRMSFHPKWKVLVNGELKSPLWVAPGYLAVRLPLGTSHVSVSFEADPTRLKLFYFGVGILLLSIGYLIMQSIVEDFGRIGIRKPA